MSKRTEKLTDLWLDEAVERVINVRGNSQLTTDSTYIYSYGTTIARIDRDNKVVVTKRPFYSHTTNAHINHLVYAAKSKGYKVIEVRSLIFTRDNLRVEISETTDKVLALIEKHIRSRVADYTRAIEDLYYNILRLRDYIPLYGVGGIRVNSKEMTYLKTAYRLFKNIDLTKDNAKKLYLTVVHSIRKDIKAYERKSILARRAKEHRDWYKGSSTKPTRFKRYYDGTYLKVVHDRVVTGKGDNISYKVAKLMYDRWTKGEDIVGKQLGHYSYMVREHSTTGVKIDCSVFHADELHKIFGGIQQ